MKTSFLLPLALCTAGVAHFALAADTTKPEAIVSGAAVAAPAGAAEFKLPDPIAVVEGTEIKAAEIERLLTAYFQRSGKSAAEIPAEEQLKAARMLLQNAIAQRLVNTRCKDVKITDQEVEEAFQAFMKRLPDRKKFEEQMKANGMDEPTLRLRIRESLAQKKWIESQIGTKGDVSDADAKAFFESHPQYFDLPETVHVAHILVMVPEGAKPEVVEEKKKAIEAAAARIAKGDDFAAVAKDVSEDPGSKANGGDVGFLAHNNAVPEFADAAFALKSGEISKPVKTKFGFHLIKASERKAARKLPFDEARTDIISKLGQQKKQEAGRTFMAELMHTAQVKINLPEEKPATPAPAPASKDAK